MKKILHQALFTAAMLLGCSAKGQTLTEDVIFSMDITVKDSTISLTSAYGCAWKTIEVATKASVIIVSSEGVLTSVDNGVEGDFVFTITCKNDELLLYKLQGAKWNLLRLQCAKKGCVHTVTDASVSE